MRKTASRCRLVIVAGWSSSPKRPANGRPRERVDRVHHRHRQPLRWASLNAQRNFGATENDGGGAAGGEAVDHVGQRFKCLGQPVGFNQRGVLSGNLQAKKR